MNAFEWESEEHRDAAEADLWPEPDHPDECTCRECARHLRNRRACRSPHPLDVPQQVGESIDGAVSGMALVTRELARQDAKWGEQNHADGTGPGTRPLRRLAVNPDLRSAVELANAAKRRCDAEHDTGRGTWVSILLEEVFEACAEDDPARLRAELVQVAAVALQWADAIDRRTMGATK